MSWSWSLRGLGLGLGLLRRFNFQLLHSGRVYTPAGFLSCPNAVLESTHGRIVVGDDEARHKAQAVGVLC